MLDNWNIGSRILKITSHNLIRIRIYPLPYPYLSQNLLPYFIFICLINSDTDNFHFHFGSDADVSDTNRHFLEYEYQIFRIIHCHFPPLSDSSSFHFHNLSMLFGFCQNMKFTSMHHNYLQMIHRFVLYEAS